MAFSYRRSQRHNRTEQIISLDVNISKKITATEFYRFGKTLFTADVTGCNIVRLVRRRMKGRRFTDRGQVKANDQVRDRLDIVNDGITGNNLSRWNNGQHRSTKSKLTIRADHNRRAGTSLRNVNIFH